jgi:uncharacterized tellurite resistance protein B-like protein
MSIWDVLRIDRGFLRDSGSASDSAAEAVREIVAKLEGLEPERARYVAAFAFILGRVAHVDLEISPEETRAMERIVNAHGGLGEAEAILVVQIAKAQHRLLGSTENYTVTREFSRSATQEQKEGLLDCLFAVSAADRNVSGAEESEIRRIVKELDLTHADFIAARTRCRKEIDRPAAGPES